jgi:hypothetical protein
MAIFANTQTSYVSKGNREDLIDLIYNIDPIETPFMSGIKKVDATATKHEWQTDNLAAPAANAKLEGDDVASVDAVNATARWDNYCQISTKSFAVTRTQEKNKSAGRKSELNYQQLKKGKELKRDMELALTQNSTYNVGAAATARQLRGLEGWIFTNDVLGAGGVSPVPSTNTAQTDGTARALTETLLQSVIQLAWAAGGEPDTIMCGGTQKQTISGFTGGTTKFTEASEKKLVAAIDFYVSDFGTLKVVPNRFQRARTVFVLDMSYWKIGMFDDIKFEQLAKTGDATKYLGTVEYTLEACNEASSGAIRDCL